MKPSGKGFLQVVAVLQWWFFNVLTVILNKYLFQVYEFHFPLTLSTIHFVVSSIGAFVVIKVLKLKPMVVVERRDHVRRILPMASIFCLNIVLGNLSLRFVPVSFMQTVKSFTPASTVFLQWLVWKKRFHPHVYWSLVPVIGGIFLTSVTEVSFVMAGFLAAFFGCFVTSTKTILAEVLLHGKYKFDSINTVFYMAPIATLLLAPPALLLEGSGVRAWAAAEEGAPHGGSLTGPLVALLVSGAGAFALNFSIFFVIHTTSAITFNVAGNMKTAVAIAISWLIFRNPISLVNGLGCAITLVGCTVYGAVRQRLGPRAEIRGSSGSAAERQSLATDITMQIISSMGEKPSMWQRPPESPECEQDLEEGTTGTKGSADKGDAMARPSAR
eukprot:jgi/Mesvir1/4081/Mv11446-RA.1